MKYDDISIRMKENYENRTRYFLPRRTYTLLRLDGCHFKTYTKGLDKPFDKHLSDDLNQAVVAMLPKIQGAKFAYVQSDEISILLTDFEKITTSAWFDGNLQKLASVSASMLTAYFNKFRGEADLAFFDSRAFTIPDRTEVINAFIWRNQDCIRNAISMIAQSMFTHKELQGVSTLDLIKKIEEKEPNWRQKFDQKDLYGRLIVKEEYFERVDTANFKVHAEPVLRTRWDVKPAWKFTENPEALSQYIPHYA